MVFLKRIKIGFQMSFSEKELIPTTTLFLLSTLFFSILKVGLFKEDLENAITSSKWLIIGLNTFIIYLILYLIFSSNAKLAKFINKDDRLGLSLLFALFWISLSFIVSYYVSDLISGVLIDILFPFAIVWMVINALTLNATIMDYTGVDDYNSDFSVFKFALGILLILGIIYLNLYFGPENFTVIYYWVFVGAVFIVLAILDYKNALSTGLYYAGAFFYLFFYFWYYLVGFSAQLDQAKPILSEEMLILVNVLTLLINYLFFFLAVGKFADFINVDEAKGRRFQILTIVTCLVSLSFIGFEFLLYKTSYLNPQLFLLQFRFLGITATSVIAYLIVAFSRQKKNKALKKAKKMNA